MILATKTNHSVERDHVAEVAQAADGEFGGFAAGFFFEVLAFVVRGDDDWAAVGGAGFDEVEPDGFGVFGPVALLRIGWSRLAGLR